MPMIKYSLSKLSIFAILFGIWMPVVAIAAPDEAQAPPDRQTIASLDLTLQKNPRDVDAYLQRGRLYAKLDRRLLAIADYTEAIRLDPSYAIAYNDRAMAKLNLKDYLGAYLDYSQVIRLRPDEAITYNNRAAARHQLGDCKGSIADLRVAVELFRIQGDEFNYQRALTNLKYFQRSAKR
jgi:tetratricopeptide (TPR) repeat protein